MNNFLNQRPVLPPLQSSYSMDGLSPLSPDMDRVSFRSAVQAPLQNMVSNAQQAVQNTKVQLQAKAPGFFRKNAQFMLIMVLVVILSILCLMRITTEKALPISVGLMISTMVMYFIWKYKNSVPPTQAAFAGWIFALVLFISIVIMSVYVEKVK